MKLKLMLAVLALAGLAAALALATPTQAGDGTTGTTGTTTTSAGEHHGKGDKGEKKHAKPSCQRVSLKGSSATGSVSFTVTRSSKAGASLVGNPATLTIPAGSSVNANACIDAAGALTLQGLEVRTQHVPPTATTPATKGK